MPTDRGTRPGATASPRLHHTARKPAPGTAHAAGIAANTRRPARAHPPGQSRAAATSARRARSQLTRQQHRQRSQITVVGRTPHTEGHAADQHALPRRVRENGRLSGDAHLSHTFPDCHHSAPRSPHGRAQCRPFRGPVKADATRRAPHDDGVAALSPLNATTGHAGGTPTHARRKAASDRTQRGQPNTCAYSCGASPLVPCAPRQNAALRKLLTHRPPSHASHDGTTSVRRHAGCHRSFLAHRSSTLPYASCNRTGERPGRDRDRPPGRPPRATALARVLFNSSATGRKDRPRSVSTIGTPAQISPWPDAGYRPMPRETSSSTQTRFLAKPSATTQFR